jgi:uncharacterized protein YllA (UPF0747 family)
MDPVYINTAIAAIVGTASLTLYQFIKRAIKRELQNVITEVVSPELEKINDRIDETHKRIDNHMDEEEADIKSLINILSKMAQVSEDEIKRQLGK